MNIVFHPTILVGNSKKKKKKDDSLPTSKAISKTVLNRLAEARRKRYPPEPSEQHRLHSVITAAGLTPPRDGQLAEAII